MPPLLPSSFEHELVKANTGGGGGGAAVPTSYASQPAWLDTIRARLTLVILAEPRGL